MTDQARPRTAALRLVHLMALVLTLCCTAPRHAQAEPSEQAVKAALIFNVTRFVEWPEATFASAQAPMIVAILGQDGVSDALESMLRRKTVNGHPVQVRHVSTPEAARNCHVVYVASSEQRHAASILEVLRGAPTLTVAEFEQFAERGGHIDLVLEDHRVHLVVNADRATESHLKLSARLLSLARIVEATP